MKKLLLVIFLVIFCGVFGEVNAQCVATADDPCVSVKQSTLDRMAKALDTLKAAEVTIEKQAAALKATDAERAAWLSFKEITESAIAILQKGIADRDKVIELQDKVIKTLADLTDKLVAKINQPRSAWSKFLEVIKEIALLATGVVIGGRLPL